MGTNPVYYKATVQERGQDATVTVKHDNNETVVLKSRTCPRSKLFEPGRSILLQGCMCSSEDSDQPAYPQTLRRAFFW